MSDLAGTNCAPFVAVLFCFVMRETSVISFWQADVIEAFNSTTRYLDDLLNIYNPYIKQMVGWIYPTEPHLKEANSFDTEAPFLELDFLNGIVSSKIYDKLDYINLEIVNFPFCDGDNPHSHSYGVYGLQVIPFVSVCSNVSNSKYR